MPAHRLSVALLAALLPLTAFAQAPAKEPAAVEREVVGNRTSENIPAIPAELIERLNRYQNTRGAYLAGWTKDGCLLVSTRFAETYQAHRVCQPRGMREQLTFYPEPLGELTPAPAHAWRDGFVFGKDKGGDEFDQLYWFDYATRGTTLLTDGKNSQNGGVVLNHDGSLMAYSSTARNGADTDVWVRDTRTGQARAAVTEGGSWRALDFSSDGTQLLVSKYVSVSESYPGAVDLETGKLELFPVDGGKAAFGDFRFAPNGKSPPKAVYFVSDEPLHGKPSEFRTLRYHEWGSGKLEQISAGDWDVDSFRISADGKYLAYTSNEDGIDRLHVVSLPTHTEVELPELPIGVTGGFDFSPDGKRIALHRNTATSPSDAYVIDLAAKKLERWTQSEVGGLDAASRAPSPRSCTCRRKRLRTASTRWSSTSTAAQKDSRSLRSTRPPSSWPTNWAWRCWCRTCAAPAATARPTCRWTTRRSARIRSRTSARCSTGSRGSRNWTLRASA